MLIELRVQNFAVIERLSVRLEQGLNVLTGETGAGKSIIVDALSLLLGERASTEYIREGADRAVVEGVFDVASHDELPALLAEQGIDAEDGLLILRREVAAEGRNRAWVNGSATTATFVGELGRRLVDLHGQHEHQTLIRPDEQRLILDAYGGQTELADAVRDAHAGLREAVSRLEQLDQQRREIEQRADFLRFQLEEIDKAKLRPDEEAQLEEEANRLEHSEDLARLSELLHQGLYADDASVVERLGALRRELDQLIRIDPSQASGRELMDAAFYNLEELGRQMGDYAAGVEHDPGRLDEIRRRQDLIYRLRTKYGESVAEVLETAARARAELEMLDGAGFERQQLERAVEERRAELDDLCDRLSRGRAEAAEALAGEVQAVLPDVGLDSGRFEVRLEPHDEVTAHGAEQVTFAVALNVGFEPRPLARAASGGELSRVMLALKTILARVDRVPSLVFDEIDAGIGGKVAIRIGEKLRAVAEHHQVFVITHLPQIAARAHNHVLVEKVEYEGTTLTRLNELKDDDRVRELARMLGGDPESHASLEHARELLG